VEAIYDSGSNVTLINCDLIKKVRATINKYRSVFKTLSGRNFTKSRATLPIKINNIEENIEVQIIKNSNFVYDLLLGLDAIKKFKLIQNENLEIHQRVNGNRIQKIQNTGRKKMDLNNEIVRSKDRMSNREDRFQDRINKMIHDYNDTFAKDKFDIGTVGNVEAQIKLLGDRYTAKKPYRCSIPDQREIDHQIDNLLERQLIEESSPPFSAPVTLAYKKQDGRKTRLCIDFRELNKIIVPESQPFPRIEDLLTKLCNCNWFSTLDINSAFLSIPIREKD